MHGQYAQVCKKITAISAAMRKNGLTTLQANSKGNAPTCSLSFRGTAHGYIHTTIEPAEAGLAAKYSVGLMMAAPP